MIALKALLLAAVVLAAAPTHTPPSTPTDTTTPAPTPIARILVVTAIVVLPTATPPPTSTPVPTGAYSGTVPTGGDGSGPGWGFGILGVLHWFDFFGSLGSGVVGWFMSGIDDLVRAVAGVLTGTPRPDRWPALAGFIVWLQSVGLGAAGAFLVIGAVLHVRAVIAGDVGGSLAGMAILQRAIEAAILVPLTGWITGQLLDLCAAVSDTMTGQYGHLVAADVLTRLVSVFTDGGVSGATGMGALTNPLTIVVGIASVVMYALIVLLRLSAVALLAWLVALGPLALATWPIGSRVAGRWFWNTTAVALWGAGWAAWLLVVHAAQVDVHVTPLLQPFVVLALLLFGYGIPRQVDNLLGTASASGGSGLAGLAAGVGTAVASQGLTKALAPTFERVFPGRRGGGIP